MAKKQEVINEASALVEMYKAGFLDGFRTCSRVKSKKEFEVLNKFYKLAFNKRFGKKINKILKKK